MNDEIICDVCGKDISDPVRTRGSHCIEIGVRLPESNRGSFWVQRQFGVYRPGQYRICVECILKGHGVKPNKEEQNENQDDQSGQPSQEDG